MATVPTTESGPRPASAGRPARWSVRTHRSRGEHLEHGLLSGSRPLRRHDGAQSALDRATLRARAVARDCHRSSRVHLPAQLNQDRARHPLDARHGGASGRTASVAGTWTNTGWAVWRRSGRESSRCRSESAFGSPERKRALVSERGGRGRPGGGEWPVPGRRPAVCKQNERRWPRRRRRTARERPGLPPCRRPCCRCRDRHRRYWDRARCR
ncbi:hypothetical protein SAMN05216388_105515 [Halorientalis persicus]|uniref:Uncharacterized protein n=1 Tax=Halorientalis persicus TaxID=1367881 RepID=A0A1H8WEH7_9EURY|nr:hypothetical protein SAMN05216388_105515 [Halorientalis persicus]